MEPVTAPTPAQRPAEKPLLIASDIDGTFITSADRVTPRLRDVVMRARREGAEIALVTGRPHRWLYPVLDQLPFRPVCITANGAVMFDSATEEIVTRHELAPQTMRDVVKQARKALYDATSGSLALAVERVGADAFASDEECFAVTKEYVHTWAAGGFAVETDEEITSQPAVKLLLRNPDMTAPEMHRIIAPWIDPEQAHVTYSMNEGLLEVAVPGVNKALGVRALCELHDVPRERTVAFGDMANDIEMLEWVNFGVAMGNANPEVKAVADYVGPSNDENGVAEVLEWWF
ncbi:HAD-family hydrolase [Corynebacterium renale]|uniref:HAD family hydrolase n=1 Tax=Corynebacterium renale TaxID=1724 RepID=UPI000DA3862D|nr:HAD family hydrolase [Corynebacterium renale]SQG63496.1 HAD-family hydrolase [Corynebacterium renale]STD00434.1 HAD-family hydrolase [Corynebacterium renale]